MRCGAICRVSAATRRALKTRTLAEEQRTPGGCGASSSRYLKKICRESFIKTGNVTNKFGSAFESGLSQMSP